MSRDDRETPAPDAEKPRHSVSGQDLTDFLLGLPSAERRRLMTLLTSRVEPRRIIEPLTEEVQQILVDLEMTEMSKAEVKDAVRRALIEAMQVRQTHLAQLAQIRQLCDKSESHSALKRKIHDFCQTTGLLRITNMDNPSLFRVVAGSGEYAVVEQPAYVDEATGRLVIAGEIRLTSVPPEAKKPNPPKAGKPRGAVRRRKSSRGRKGHR